MDKSIRSSARLVGSSAPAACSRLSVANSCPSGGDRIVGTLIDAGFDAERISAVSPDDQAAGTATPAGQPTPGGRGLAAWLIDHLRQRGLSHEHAQRYQDHVAQGRRLVSVTVTTDAEDEEARSLMVDIGADEISSAADGTMRVIHQAPPPGAVPPTA